MLQKSCALFFICILAFDLGISPIQTQHDERIEIDDSYVSDEGADVGSIQAIGFHAKWDNNSDVVEGSIYVNGTEHTINHTGWVNIEVTSYVIGKEEWVVTGVNCSGATAFNQTASNPSIFWGKAAILLWQQFLYWNGYGLPTGSKFFFEPLYEWWQIRWSYVPSNNESYSLTFWVYVYKWAIDMFLLYEVIDTGGRTEAQYRFVELDYFMVIVELANIEYVEIWGEHLDDGHPLTLDNYNGEWHNSDFTITLSASDGISGVLETYYQINEDPIRSVSAHGQPLMRSEGTNNTLEYWSIDRAGNSEPRKILKDIKLDKTPPTATIDVSGLIGDNGWFISNVTATLNATDSLSGVGSIKYSFDNIDWVTYVSPLTIADQGQTFIRCRSTDIAGNVRTPEVVTVKIDTLFPMVGILSPANKTYAADSILLTLRVDEQLSWIGYSLDGQTNVTISGNTTLTGVPVGQHSLKVYASDMAGNAATSDIVHFRTETPQPSHFTTEIAAVTIAIIAGVAALVFFARKRRRSKIVA